MFSAPPGLPILVLAETKGHHRKTPKERWFLMQEVIHRPLRPCPFCRCLEVYRTRSKGIIERHLLRVVHLCPYRCTSCDRRFYAGAASRGANHTELVTG
jgi:hypothetical protein